MAVDTQSTESLSYPTGAMVAGGKSIGMAMKLDRRKALLDEETTSTNAPRLVYQRPQRRCRDRPSLSCKLYQDVE
jgi:hypothetical protein